MSLCVVLPLLGGGTAWFQWEYSKTKCAYQSFAKARHTLILTGETAEAHVAYGSIKEQLSLLPLESLDQGPKGLKPSDLGKEVSRLSEDALRSYRQLQEWASSKS